MVPIKLCLGSGNQPAITNDICDNVKRTNDFLRRQIQQRERDLMALDFEMTNHIDGSYGWWGITFEIRQHMLGLLPGTRYSGLKISLPSALTPLNECILAILWELQETPLSRLTLGDGNLKDFITLIQSAAHFQADTESVSYLTTP
jgi:hypothetical protein